MGLGRLLHAAQPTIPVDGRLHFRRKLARLPAVLAAAIVMFAGGATGVLAGQAVQQALSADGSGVPAPIRDAAARLRAAPGFEFTVDQTTYTVAAGLDVSNRTNGTFWSRVLSKGSLTGDGFWQEVYGADEASPADDFAADEFAFGSIYSSAGQWRNELGGGWYPDAETPPGLGFDLVSASRLPELLEHLSDVSGPFGDADGLTRYEGLADVVDYPGIIVSDGRAFTASPFTVRIFLDGSGRIARLEAVAANLNAAPDAMLVETKVRFTFGGSLALPEPSPLIPAPDQGGVSAEELGG